MTLLTPDNTDPVIDDSLDYLVELTKPGAKFDRAKYQSEADMYKDIAKGKWHADKTLEVSQRRTDELRNDFNREREQNLTRTRLEDAMTQFARQPLASSDITPANEDREVKPAIDPAELETLISSGYRKEREREKQESNYNSVLGKLQDRYGNNYREVLATQSNELGLSDQDITQMARNNPKVFMRTFGLDQEPKREGFQAPPRSTYNFTPSAPKRTWSYYQNMKKDKPDDYYSPKIQNQMVDDYSSLGDAFEDGNFHQYH